MQDGTDRNQSHGNGDAQRLQQLAHAIDANRQPAAVEEPSSQFSLADLGRYLAQDGQELQSIVRDFGHELLKRERRKLAYLEQIVGKITG